MPGPRTALIALALAAAAAASGCGGDDGGPGRTETVNASSGLTVSADEYKFDPKNVVVTGADGRPAQLRLTLRNDGALAHDLRLSRDGADVGGTPIFQGGRSRTVRVSLQPGRYEMFCSVGNHRQLGMEGSLEVK